MNIYVVDALAVAAALVCIKTWASRRKRAYSRASLPPGPKGLPLIGNALDMPSEYIWEAARQLGEKYGEPVPVDKSDRLCILMKLPGDFVYVEIFGTRYIFMNSYDIAVDLFEKRGSAFCHRPTNTMLDL